MNIFNLFKSEPCTDYVDISIGRVYLKPLNNGVIRRATIKSTISGSILNNELYFVLIENELLKLSKKQINKLSLKDGESIRTKLKEILVRHNLITIDEPNTEFSKSELEQFQEQEASMVARLIGKNGKNS